jgi:predicted  nucleic acid-binding Zn-ribbon protein
MFGYITIPVQEAHKNDGRRYSKNFRFAQVPRVPLPRVFLDTGRRGGGPQVNPNLRKLIALQDLDTKIVTLKKQITEIPERASAWREESEKLEKSHQERVLHGQELAKQRRSRESDVELMRTKLSKLRDQLMAVKTNREYTAMLHEIQTAEDQIRHAEDGILEIMEGMESTVARLSQEESALKTRQAELRSQIRNAEETVPRLEAEIARLAEEKLALEGQIEAELLRRYRRIADSRKGIALAEAAGELCSACHVRIRPQMFAELLRTDGIHVCDSCSRILFVRDSA